MKGFALVILMAAVFSFLFHVKKVGDARVEWAALKAEVAEKTSFGTVASVGVRSFFDGFTFGAFADEGIFTESKKMERWSIQVARREAELRTAHGAHVWNRNWSLIVGICAGLGLVFMHFRRVSVPGNRAHVAKAVEAEIKA